MSVVIPAYNAARFIEKAVASVFGQSYREHELVVVNDGSPDTAELETVLGPWMHRLVYVLQENQGPGGARNTGVARARGALVAFLDADDVWEPHFLESQVRFLLESDPPYDLVYSDAWMVGDSPRAGRTFMQGAPSRGAATFESLLRQDCTVLTCTVVARRQVLLDAGLFDPTYYHSEDFDLWLRIAHRGGRIGFQRDQLARRLAHDASLTAQEGALLRSQVPICGKLLAQLDLSGEQRRLLETHRDWASAQLALIEGKRAFIGRRFADARRQLAYSIRVLRSARLTAVLLGLYVAPSLLHWVYRRRHADALPATPSQAA